MDVQRPDLRRRKTIRRVVWVVVAVLLTGTISVLVGRLEQALPSVEWATVWPDTVKRGPMVLQVHGMGTLVAEDTLVIPALSDGRVVQIIIRPGARVEPDSLIVTMSNAELDQQAVDAEYQVKMAEARYQELRVQLRSQTLTQKADLARVENETNQARLRHDRDKKLFEEGLIVELNFKLTKSNAEELDRRLEIERERLTIREESDAAQLAVQRAEIDKLKALHRLRLDHVEALQVRAGVAGVLQELPVQIGQRVMAGAIVAKVAQPTRLKAELKVAETQAKDISLGQPAQIDTRNGVIAGRVSRIDPAAREGTVLVDVKLEGQLPQGARPDLNVDGIIELERLNDVIYVGRPAFAQPNGVAGLFRVRADRKQAERVQVKFGRSSVSTIEIKEGLKVGDQVILSEVPSVEGHNRIRIE